MGLMSKDGSDGSEGSEGKEGSDGMFNEIEQSSIHLDKIISTPDCETPSISQEIYQYNKNIFDLFSI